MMIPRRKTSGKDSTVLSYVNIVDNESDLGGSERGEGGFGSTGN